MVFDGVRTCDNACTFCFVAQLPAGLRPSLYVRDDDYRLSFLSGNFITLTNLIPADVERIVRMRLSPLHVSVHAVTPDVRRRLICPTGKDAALPVLDDLLAAGIAIHVQIVLVPGINDGDELQATLAFLAARDGIASVGVVPLGYTGHQHRFSHSFEGAQASGDVLAALTPWRTRMRAERGVFWVHAADEFHLNAGVEVPPAAEYDDFPQYENGIGMVRGFLDGLPETADARLADVTFVTGQLFAPVLRRAFPDAPVLPVPNRLFGGNVSVAGLLSGADIADAIAADTSDGIYAVPDVTLNADGLFLDDLTPADVRERSCADVRMVSSEPTGPLELR
ncbi:MAG: Fe-S oxidoreductase [Coriobacteriaceae bacterium]|nr:Fe-S oxidoreductase [Coriobacteriaceae bacterium]